MGAAYFIGGSRAPYRVRSLESMQRDLHCDPVPNSDESTGDVVTRRLAFSTAMNTCLSGFEFRLRMALCQEGPKTHHRPDPLFQ
jgi:hypothetical protein